MKNVIKKIASIAMAFTLLGTGTTVTNTISPKSSNTIVADAASCKHNCRWYEGGIVVQFTRTSLSQTSNRASYKLEMLHIKKCSNCNRTASKSIITNPFYYAPLNWHSGEETIDKGYRFYMTLKDFNKVKSSSYDEPDSYKINSDGTYKILSGIYAGYEIVRPDANKISLYTDGSHIVQTFKFTGNWKKGKNGVYTGGTIVNVEV